MNYTVGKGETLGIISQKFFGTTTKWRDIWTANPQISNPDVIRVGQIITIPSTSKALVPVTQPVIEAKFTPVLQSTGSVADKIRALLQDRRTLIILSIGLVGAAYLISQRNKKLA